MERSRSFRPPRDGGPLMYRGGAALNAPTVTPLVGHVLDRLRELPDASVHCVVTSPPYWGLRDYSRCGCSLKSPTSTISSRPDESANPGSASSVQLKEPDPNCPKCHGSGKDDSLTVIWDAVEGCEHEWTSESRYWDNRSASLNETTLKGDKRDARGQIESSFCLKCGAWRGQLGLEPTIDLYVKHIVAIFREVRRVLRDDGTCWINLGDCYSGGKGEGGNSKGDEHGQEFHGNRGNTGLKPKDMVGMPWRVAFALQADGWWLRSAIIWSKLNPMPESTTDRPTSSYEHVFLLAKAERYFY